MYEHLDDFVGVDKHDPAKICLLCESCHGRITRKQWSKERARLAYERIQARSLAEAGDHHVLASEHSYAVGVHFDNGHMNWTSPQLVVTRAAPNGIAIEIEDGAILRERFNGFKAAGKGVWLATADEAIIMHSPAGAMIPQLGISIASGCSFDMYAAAAGAKTLDQMRDSVFYKPAREMRMFLASKVT